MSFGNTWDDAFELLPLDAGLISIGAGQIRTLKDAISERLQIDHEFAASGSGTDTGYHKKVTLKKTTNAEPASGYTALAAEGSLLTYFPEGDSEHTLADLDSTQTLTNKTITGTFTGNITGDVTGNVTGNITGSSGSCTGNSATASAWATGRTLTLSGDVSGTSSSWTGSGNATLVTVVADDSHNHGSSTIAGLDAGDITGSVTGSGNIVKATSPTIVTPTIADGSSIKDVRSIKDQSSTSSTGLTFRLYEIGAWNLSASTTGPDIIHGGSASNMISITGGYLFR